MTRTSAALLAVMLLGLALRAGFILRLRDTHYQPDEGVYVSIARNLRATGVYGVGTVPAADKPPVTPLLLAGAFSVSDRLLLARLLWALMSLASAWLLWRHGTLAFGPKAGALAGGAAAVYPFFVYWSGILMSETPAVFFTVAGLYLAERLRRGEARPGEAWLAGAAWGLAVLTRSQYLYVWLVLTAWLAWDASRARRRFPLGAFVLPVLLLAGGWAVRNRISLGTWTMDTHAGYTLLIRTMFYEQDNVDTGVASAALEKADFYPEALALPEAERDKFFLRKAKEWVRANPGRFLRQCAGNFLQYWRFYPRLDKTVGVVDSAFLSSSRGLFVAVSLLTEPWLILLGAAGLVIGFRRGRPVMPLAIFIACNALIHTLVISQMRYRLPVMPAVILLAAYAAAELHDALRRRHG